MTARTDDQRPPRQLAGQRKGRSMQLRDYVLRVPLRSARIALFVAALVLGGGVAKAADPANTLYMELVFGRVVIELQPTVAPRAVEQIKRLVRQGFYDGIGFDRVIGGVMAQIGDPGSSGRTLRPEFSAEKFTRGVVAMAHTSDSNNADSQFFITLATAPTLEGKNTIFGHVVSGMEYVDKIRKGDPANDGRVANPDKIVKMQVASDVLTAVEKARQPTEKPGENQNPDQPAKMKQFGH
jgi:peptidylprolyl isomerase